MDQFSWTSSSRSIGLQTIVFVVGLFVGITQAAEPVNLQTGDVAPSFTAVDDNGKPWKSSDYVGKQIVVVYFYPADMTPGCTKQACGFRDDMRQLTTAGVKVVGVSGDAVRNHQLFKQAEHLNFTLLSDESGAVASAFGVPHRDGKASIVRTINGNEETLTRKATMSRWTFVIDRDGKIALKNTKVNAAQDSQEILKLVETLK